MENDRENKSQNIVIEQQNTTFRDTNNEDIRRKMCELENYEYPNAPFFASQRIKDDYEAMYNHGAAQQQFIQFLVSKIACSGSAQFQTWAGTQNSNFQTVYSNLMEVQKDLFLANQKVNYYESDQYCSIWKEKVKDLESKLSAAEEQAAIAAASAESQQKVVNDFNVERGQLKDRIEELEHDAADYYATAENNFQWCEKLNKQLQQLKSQSDMQAREELKRKSQQLANAVIQIKRDSEEIAELNQQLDSKDDQIAMLQAELEELKNPPTGSREPSFVPVNFKQPIDEQLISNVKSALAGGMSKNRIMQTYHISHAKVDAIAAMA